MSKVKPLSEMNGITNEESAREYIVAVTRNIADQTARSTMIAVEWGIEPSYITTLLIAENERAQKDMILDAIKYMAFRPDELGELGETKREE